MTHPHAAKARTSGASQFALPRGWPWAVMAFFVLGAAALLQAAAVNNLRIAPARALGTGFYAWRAEMAQLQSQLANPRNRLTASQLKTIGRNLLAQEPLSVSAMRTVALGYDAARQPDDARRAMLAADRLSRRDGIAGAWLLNDAIRNDDARLVLRQFDRLQRTTPALQESMQLQLTSVLGSAAARQALVRYVRQDTPWLGGFFSIAANRAPRVAPLAQLVVDRGRLMPDTPQLRESYGTMVTRLAQERRFDLLARAYPLLPGVALQGMSSADSRRHSLEQGYPPLIWDLASESDWGGAVVPVEGGGDGIGLEFFALAETNGLTGRKLALLPAGNHRLRWRVVERDNNPRASANWQISCLADGRTETLATIQSTNLMAADAPARGQLALPPNCRVVMVEMRMSGGTGADPARIVIADLQLS